MIVGMGIDRGRLDSSRRFLGGCVARFRRLTDRVTRCGLDFAFGLGG